MGMSMLGVRRLGMFNKLKKAAKKAGKSVANKAKGAACKAFGGKALGMCKQAVKAGVNKAADALKKKIPKLNPSLAKPCLEALGNAMCDKAYKKACGRRMVAIPAPVKKAMKGVWNAVKGDVKNFKSCMIKAAKGAAKKAIMSKLPKGAGSFMSMLGVRRLGMFKKLKKAAKNMANKAKGAACKAFGGKALGMCKQAVKA